jgi:hypothetical protein
MIRNLILASAIVVAAGSAHAEGPRLIGSGDNAQLVYEGPRGNVAGGGVSQLEGTRPNARQTYTQTITPPGRLAVLSGTGDDAVLSYLPQAAPVAAGMAATGARTPRG